MHADAGLAHCRRLGFQSLLDEVAITDHQQGTRLPRRLPLQQAPGTREPLAQSTAGETHQVGGQRRQQVPEGVTVLGDGCHHVCHGGEGDEPHLDTGIGVQQILDFLSGATEPARTVVHHVHGTRQVEQDHEVGSGARDRDLGEVPAGTRHGQDREDP